MFGLTTVDGRRNSGPHVTRCGGVPGLRDLTSLSCSGRVGGLHGGQWSASSPTTTRTHGVRGWGRLRFAGWARRAPSGEAPSLRREPGVQRGRRPGACTRRAVWPLACTRWGGRPRQRATVPLQPGGGEPQKRASLPRPVALLVAGPVGQTSLRARCGPLGLAASKASHHLQGWGGRGRRAHHLPPRSPSCLGGLGCVGRGGGWRWSWGRRSWVQPSPTFGWGWAGPGPLPLPQARR